MQSDLLRSFATAKKRLLLLDYDGTLVHFHENPIKPKPTPQVLDILQKLVANPRNTVVVVSGRDKQTLDGWLGQMGASLSAEHGVFRKDKGAWRATIPIADDWKECIRAAMQKAVIAAPGSFIEEKETALVWHYRPSAPAAAKRASDNLLPVLQPLAKGLRIMPGNKVIEVKLAGMDKGKAAAQWATHGQFDFILAAGDDVTDEDMFAALQSDAYTVKVGDGPTKARERVASVDALLDLLEQMTQM